MINAKYAQVGRNCLADFLGFDPHGAASMAEILASCDAFAGACEGESFGQGGSSNYYSIAGYLPWVAMTIRTEGWLSKGKAWEAGNVELATANIAANAMSDIATKYRRGERVDPIEEPSEADHQTAQKTIAFCAEYFDSCDESKLSDYEHNLRVSMMNSVCEPRSMGIIASAINYASRQQEKKAEYVDFSKSQYVGTLKERAAFKNLKVVFAPFGNRPCVFVDDAGNKVTAYPKFDVVKGESYNIVGTPTKQDEWNGVKSTYINRVALATEKDLAPKTPRKPRAKKMEPKAYPFPCGAPAECSCPKCQGIEGYVDMAGNAM